MASRGVRKQAEVEGGGRKQWDLRSRSISSFLFIFILWLVVAFCYKDEPDVAFLVPLSPLALSLCVPWSKPPPMTNPDGLPPPPPMHDLTGKEIPPACKKNGQKEGTTKKRRRGRKVKGKEHQTGGFHYLIALIILALWSGIHVASLTGSVDASCLPYTSSCSIFLFFFFVLFFCSVPPVGCFEWFVLSLPPP